MTPGFSAFQPRKRSEAMLRRLAQPLVAVDPAPPPTSARAASQQPASSGSTFAPPAASSHHLPAAAAAAAPAPLSLSHPRPYPPPPPRTVYAQPPRPHTPLQPPHTGAPLTPRRTAGFLLRSAQPAAVHAAAAAEAAAASTHAPPTPRHLHAPFPHAPQCEEHHLFQRHVPPSMINTRKLITTINFLVVNRPDEAEPFAAAAFQLYRNEFSRTERMRRASGRGGPAPAPAAAGAEHPPNAPMNGVGPAAQGHNVPGTAPQEQGGYLLAHAPGKPAQSAPPSAALPALVPPTANGTGNAAMAAGVPAPDVPPPPPPPPTTVRMSTHSQPTVFQPQSRMLQPPRLHLPRLPALHPQQHATTPTTAPTEAIPPGQADPHLIPEAHTAHPPTEAASQSASRGSAEVVEVVPCDTESVPRLHDFNSPHGCRRLRIETIVRERFIRFTAACAKMPDMTPNKMAYIIWEPPPHPVRSREAPPPAVHLPTTVAHSSKALLNNDSLASMNLHALRFFWDALAAGGPAGSGAVFSHDIGFPRQYLVLMFAQLYVISSLPGTLRRVLIICSPNTMERWKSTAPRFTNADFCFHSVNEATWYKDVMDWKAKGGVLLCTFNDLGGMASVPEQLQQKKQQVWMELCNPGPDIAVVDEASYLRVCDNLALGTIYSIKTRARLALTSVPLAGNVPTFSDIMEWATPNLLGSEPEVWSRYLRPIAIGLTAGEQTEMRQEAYKSASRLCRRVRFAMLAPGLDEKREAMLTRGKMLLESSVVINLGKEEAEVYAAASKYLRDAVVQHDISCFIAVQILSVAATSVAALMKVLDGVSNVREVADLACAEDKGESEALKNHLDRKASKIGKVDDCLKHLKQRIGPIVDKGPVPSLKMLVMKTLVIESMKRRDRVVIFSNCDEVREEIMTMLKQVSIAQGTGEYVPLSVYKYDVSGSVEEAKYVESFNKAQSGAVLVAAYGERLEYMEDCGWMFVNAVRVVMMDAGWYVSGAVQALKRVHNYAQKGARKVDVFYIGAYGTVDDLLVEELERKHASLKTGTFKHNGAYCGYLVEPELAVQFTAYKHDASVKAESVPLIVREGYTGTGSSLEDLLKSFVQLKGGDGRFAIRKFEFAMKRYDTFCELLEAANQAPDGLTGWDNDYSEDVVDDVIVEIRNPLRRVKVEVTALGDQMDMKMMLDAMGSGTSFVDAHGKPNRLLDMCSRYDALYGLRGSGRFMGDDMESQRSGQSAVAVESGGPGNDRGRPDEREQNRGRGGHDEVVEVVFDEKDNVSRCPRENLRGGRNEEPMNHRNDGGGDGRGRGSTGHNHQRDSPHGDEGRLKRRRSEEEWENQQQDRGQLENRRERGDGREKGDGRPQRDPREGNRSPPLNRHRGPEDFELRWDQDRRGPSPPDHDSRGPPPSDHDRRGPPPPDQRFPPREDYPPRGRDGGGSGGGDQGELQSRRNDFLNWERGDRGDRGNGEDHGRFQQEHRW